MNRHARRTILAVLPAALVAACASQGGGVAPPTLDQVKSFIAAFVPQLPTFVNELEQAGQLPPSQAIAAMGYVTAIQTVAKQIMATSGAADAQTRLRDIAGLLTSLMSVIPAAAPFVPLVITAQAMVAAYLASQPVTDPGTNQPVPTPAPPSQQQLQSLHARTLAMRRPAPAR